MNWDSATYETYHKVAVGQPYERDNHKLDGLQTRLAAYSMRWALVMTVLDERRPDPIRRKPLIYPKDPYYSRSKKRLSKSMSTFRFFLEKCEETIRRAIRTAALRSKELKEEHELTEDEVRLVVSLFVARRLRVSFKDYYCLLVTRYLLAFSRSLAFTAFGNVFLTTVQKKALIWWLKTIIMKGQGMTQLK